MSTIVVDLRHTGPNSSLPVFETVIPEEGEEGEEEEEEVIDLRHQQQSSQPPPAPAPSPVFRKLPRGSILHPFGYQDRTEYQRRSAEEWNAALEGNSGGDLNQAVSAIQCLLYYFVFLFSPLLAMAVVVFSVVVTYSSMLNKTGGDLKKAFQAATLTGYCIALVLWGMGVVVVRKNTFRDDYNVSSIILSPHIIRNDNRTIITLIITMSILAGWIVLLGIVIACNSSLQLECLV